VDSGATKMAKRARRLPGPEYHVKVEFRAPLPYVFSWCTDFDPHDARREKEEYARKILERTSRRVVYEDLADSDQGWSWARHVVTLHPPNWWHSDSVGTHRTSSLDYVLTRLPGERTRLDLRWRRRRTPLSTQTVSKREIERSTTAAWRNFARELEKDHRASLSRRRRG
jgi:hypothetical protein